MDEIGGQMRMQGWRQDVVIPARILRDFVPAGWILSDQHHLVCISQSCDLVHHDLANEPLAQFLVATETREISAEFAHGRHPRTIRFRAPDGLNLAADAWQQITISREHLRSLNVREFPTLEASELRMLAEWLGKRFTRIAFPDDFNSALRQQGKTISQIFKKRHHLFSEVLLRLEPFDELQKGQSYQLACYLLMPPELHDDPEQLAAAQSAASRLEEAFENSGVEVVECAPVSEAHLTYTELKELMRWDYDYLTHRENVSNAS